MTPAAAFPATRLVPASLDTPAVVIDHTRLRRNITSMADRVRARRAALRPHAKTHKSVAIGRLQLEAGATGLSCATLGEAAVFADGGCDDLFVAYPVYAGGPSKPALLRSLHERCRLRVGVDSAEGARALGAALRGSPEPLDVLIEIDSGLRRTGVRPEAVVPVADAAARAGLRVAGVFTHGGHGYGIGLTEQAAGDEVTAVSAAADALERAGHDAAVRSVGSTPTSVLRPPPIPGEVTEERPGTYVFGDRQQLVLGAAADDEVALVVAATVVSTTVPGQAILDAGSKVLSSDRPDWLTGFGVLCGWPGATVARLNEHHAVVTFEHGTPRPAVGEVVAVIPNHVCPVVNLASELVLVDGSEIVDTWPVDAAGRNR